MNFWLQESRGCCGNRPVQADSSPQELGRQEVETGGEEDRRPDQSPHETGALLQEVVRNH
jgi:hypothetical protein